MMRIKGLTISQPYASLIAAGEKWVENRTWGTSYRGLLAIHAGRGTQYLTPAELTHYPHGCVIAIANLFACMPLAGMSRLSRSRRVQRSELTIGHILDHKHTEGPWCWILTDLHPITPIKISGAQGLWELDVDESLVNPNSA